MEGSSLLSTSRRRNLGRNTFRALVPAFFLAATFPARGATAPEKGLPSLSAPLTFPGAGFASVGVYDDTGKLVRSLGFAKPVEKGTETFSWDGTTDLGLPAAPGHYDIRGVWFTEGPKIKYVMKVGVSGQPPYLNEDPNSGWGAVHGPASAICANGKNLLAIFRTSESPVETGIQLMDWDGKIVSRFTSFYPFDSRHACVMDDKNLYLLVSQNYKGAQGLAVGKYDLANPPRGKLLCQVPMGSHPITSGYGTGRSDVDVLGLALRGDQLYVPVKLDDKVFVYNANSGELKQTLEVPSPRGIASFQDQVYVLSGKTLVKIGADGKPGRPIVAGLDDPAGLAIDAKGNFYIAEGGASQQVKVFSPKGQPVREIGMKGGRPRNGIFDPAGMLDPRGICVAPDGKLWVAEVADDYQVLSVWNPDGSRGPSFYNMHWSSGQGRLSPDRTELLFGTRAQEVNPGVTAYKIDLQKGTWEPSWHLGQKVDEMDQRDVLLGNEPNNPREKGMFAGHMPYLGFAKDMVAATNGKIYLTGGDYSIYLFDPKAKTAKPVSLVFTHHVEKTAAGPYQASYDQGKPNWLTWADLNGDGKMEMDETECVENPAILENVARISEVQLQPDLSVVMLAATKQGTNPPAWAVYRMAPEKVLEDGVPVYSWNKLQKVTDLQVPNFDGGDQDPNRHVTRTNLANMKLVDGSAYFRIEPGAKVRQNLSGIDGAGWWASRNWRITPERFDLATGQPAWLKLGRRAPGLAKPGEMYYPGWGLAGSSHGLDFYADTLSQVWAWTTDGLYIGPVYHSGETRDENSIHVELIGSYVYDIGDKTYIFTGDHGISVHEMTFPKIVPIAGGKVTLTPEEVAAAKPWDPDGPPPGKRPTYIARSIFDFNREAQKATRTITIDGHLDPAEWEGLPSIPLKLDGQEVGTVQVTFDNKYLYLAYDVKDPNALKNSGSELPYAPFVSGSYVDLSIAPDWSSPNRPEPADGDARVILARITGGADYQMGFWPVKQNLKKYGRIPALNPQTIVSPVQQRHFDDISPLPGLTFAYQPNEHGYTLEARIPVSSLGIVPARQGVVGFDASVAFADAAGQSRSRAVHWAGESEAAVVDRPGSAELKPSTWGTLQFNLNPVPPAKTP